MFKFYITTRNLTQNYSHFNKNSFIEIHIIFSIFRIKMFHVKHFYFYSQFILYKMKIFSFIVFYFLFSFLNCFT